MCNECSVALNESPQTVCAHETQKQIRNIQTYWAHFYRDYTINVVFFFSINFLPDSNLLLVARYLYSISATHTRSTEMLPCCVWHRHMKLRRETIFSPFLCILNSNHTILSLMYANVCLNDATAVRPDYRIQAPIFTLHSIFSICNDNIFYDQFFNKTFFTVTFEFLIYGR